MKCWLVALVEQRVSGGVTQRHREDEDGSGYHGWAAYRDVKESATYAYREADKDTYEETSS